MRLTSGRYADGTPWARATQTTRYRGDTRRETTYAVGLSMREARGRAVASMYWRLGRYVESWHTFTRTTLPRTEIA